MFLQADQSSMYDLIFLAVCISSQNYFCKVILEIVFIFYCSMNEEFLNFQDLNCIGGEKLLVNLWKV